MKGLAFGILVKTGDNTYRVDFGNLNNLVIVEGITKLAYDIVFNFLTTYQEGTKIGSFFRKVIGSNITGGSDSESAVLQLTTEIINFEKRFKTFQDESTQSIPFSERLKFIEVLDISVALEEQKAIIKIRILNELNQEVFIEV